MICCGKVYRDGHPTIIVEIDKEIDKCLVVNVTEYNPSRTYRFDPTCVLEIGIHEFINKKSIVSYQDSRVITLSRLTIDFELKELSFSEKILDSDIMYRIKKGFKNSKKQLSGEVKLFIRKIMPEFID